MEFHRGISLSCFKYNFYPHTVHKQSHAAPQIRDTENSSYNNIIMGTNYEN